MARRHGATVKNVDHPRFRLGIWHVFDPWVDPELQALQGCHITPLTRPVFIEHHFTAVVFRLSRSLACLYNSLREWDRFLEAGGLGGPQPELAIEIPQEAGIAADSVFHYLNLFIDDLARIIPFVLMGPGSKTEEPDGFSRLKMWLRKGKLNAPQTLIKLFAELDRDNSWWSLGFKRSVGIRQRLTHYTDLVFLQGRTKSGETRMTAYVPLGAVGGPVHADDFENILKKLLTDLCEWLDRLEEELIPLLSRWLAHKGIRWNPLDEPTSRTTVLPEVDGANLDPSHYLYLPVCG